MFGSHLQSRLASSPEEAGSLSVDWSSWENIRRGIHGSTSEHRDGLCAVASASHEHPGATASDLGSVGECANGRALCVYWCQDGKCATRTKARVTWKVVLFCSNHRIHLFACTHLSVSNSLVCNDWLADKHQSTARVQTRLDCGS